MAEITGILDIYGATGEPPRLVIYDMSSLKDGDLLECMITIEDGDSLTVQSLVNESDIVFSGIVRRKQKDPFLQQLTDNQLGTYPIEVWSEWFTNNHRAVLTR
jgi:hypothetical protein